MVEYIRKSIHDFDMVLANLDSLNSYFVEINNWIKNKKLRYQTEYSPAIAIKEILDTIYEQEPNQRYEYIQKINGTLINDVRLEDIMELSLDEKKETVQFVMKDLYRHEKYDPVKYRRKSESIINQEKIFTRSILSNIIIIFEQYLTNVYEVLVISSPQKYFENKTIHVSEIFKDLTAAMNNLLQNEIEDNMYNSLLALDRIKDKSQIDVDRYIRVRQDFEEIYYRRNVFVHAEGIANETYFENVDQRYLKNIQLGDELICDEIYLSNAIEILSKMVAALHFEVLKYFDASQEQYTNLANMGFEALKQGQYTLAEHVYGILRREKKFEFKFKAMYEVNFMNSLKLQGKNIDSLLDGFDVSIVTDDYKIAKECLKDNHENVYNMLSETYPRSFCAIAIREWPIFVKFRESEYYDRFINEHKEDFDVIVFENKDAQDALSDCPDENLQTD